MSTSPTAPVRDEMVGKDRLITLPWQTWLRDLVLQVTNAPASFAPVVLTGQTASLGTTSIPTPTLSAGRYRVDVAAIVETAAGVNSSLTVTIRWTKNGIAQSYSFAAMTGNTTATTLVQPPLFLTIDAASPITYETVYASTPAAAMAYGLEVGLEALR